MKTLLCVLGALSLCLPMLPGCASAPPLSVRPLIVNGCPRLTPCQLPASQAKQNRDLLRQIETTELAWAVCAAQVDMTIACQKADDAQTQAATRAPDPAGADARE
ncbi:Rz1-like lysis system protein LysC [Chitinimonas sp. BJB300]|uniref:Rz1-like lysis system protein LysC n=1 Tax=Chitinimonas sp. BJB300 TaxID=1559339 RepID=UPI001C90A479